MVVKNKALIAFSKGGPPTFSQITHGGGCALLLATAVCMQYADAPRVSICCSDVTAPSTIRPISKPREKGQTRVAPLRNKRPLRSATGTAVMASTLWCLPPALPQRN